MRTNKDFSIALLSLRYGIHQFKYQVKDNFFENFEKSPIKKGDLEVDLEFEKTTDHLKLDFEINGKINSNCDRCTADIKFPLFKQGQYIVKFDNDLEDDDIIYFPVGTQEINVAEMIYELIVLGIPLIKIYDCENDDPRPCNDTVLDYLDAPIETEENDLKPDPVWDRLSDLNFNDN